MRSRVRAPSSPPANSFEVKPLPSFIAATDIKSLPKAGHSGRAATITNNRSLAALPRISRHARASGNPPNVVLAFDRALGTVQEYLDRRRQPIARHTPSLVGVRRNAQAKTRAANQHSPVFPYGGYRAILTLACTLCTLVASTPTQEPPVSGTTYEVGKHTALITVTGLPS